MKFTLTVAFILALCCLDQATYAQSPTPTPAIDFSDVAKPHVYRWRADDPQCRNYLRDGALVTSIKTPEAHLVITLLDDSPVGDLKNYFIFHVLILNTGAQSFDLRPEAISGDVLDQQERFTGTVSALTPIEVAHKISKYGSSFFRLRPMHTTVGTVTDSQGNTATVRTYEVDRAAEAAQAQIDAARAAHQAERASETYDLALKANTVFPGRDVDGVVFFEKKRVTSKGGLIFKLPLGDIAFEIPFGRARTRK
jgi:hypothetical protein